MDHLWPLQEKGSIQIFKFITLMYVIHVPNLSYNLISIIQLTNNSFKTYHRGRRLVVLKSEGLYYFNEHYLILIKKLNWFKMHQRCGKWRSFDSRRKAHCFNEKLNEAWWNYLTYDVKVYAIVQALKFWHHYLVKREFVLNSDHKALKNLNSQKKWNYRHAKWMTYLPEFTFYTQNTRLVHKIR